MKVYTKIDQCRVNDICKELKSFFPNGYKVTMQSQRKKGLLLSEAKIYIANHQDKVVIFELKHYYKSRTLNQLSNMLKFGYGYINDYGEFVLDRQMAHDMIKSIKSKRPAKSTPIPREKPFFLYHGTIANFCTKLYLSDTMFDIAHLHRQKIHELEKDSWKFTTDIFHDLLIHCSISRDITIGFELKLPHNQNRIDVVFIGFDEERTPHVVLIEMKQWHTCGVCLEKYVLRYGNQYDNPVYQISQYKKLFSNLCAKNVQIHTCVFLPNCEHFDSLIDQGRSLDVHIFGKREGEKLIGFISGLLDQGDNGVFATLLESTRF